LNEKRLVDCLSVYNITRLEQKVKDKKCPFSFYVVLKPIVGFSFGSSPVGFGMGRGRPPNAPSIAKGLIDVPVGLVVDINFAISMIALSDSVIVILLSLIATSVC
tara:strand:+ start:932 stop:1246 length:315 start_codon:yes stop_codon:yes gene_type:complete